MTSALQGMPCLLCGSRETESIQHQQSAQNPPATGKFQRIFFHCQVCDLIFVPLSHHVSPEQEKERYSQHQNHASSAGYRKFLDQLIQPLQPFLPAGADSMPLKILDYGCGPTPALKEILAERGWSVDVFDPYFFPQPPCLGSFELILSSEVWEHFRQPRAEIDRILSFLKPPGILAIMTQFHQGREAFSTWWYAQDFTHVVFYSSTTFAWIQKNWDLRILWMQNPVVIFARQ